ncbi:hypothetical protein C2E25_06655 [Geothermobacter hydrogeniphilus]|uniref:Outer membrane protein TolC n=1 Tax=Geothermobacter hydrogeniphilus TaxID=1969733 RepID=A0A2K2HB73_9BACT|nr:TolC family protein [Geothermobacter hydrogeniphilus]PNU20552.1 hypothetical protein C2E25_06655 [Geothermobacter hydrogeniphilus]
MNRSRGPGILSLFCLLALFLPAAPGRAFTLDDCVELALRNNPGLQKQRMGPDLAQTDLSARKGLRFGRLDAVSSYTHYNLPRTLVPLTPGAIFANPAGVATTEDLFTVGIIYEIQLFTGFAQTRSIEAAALQKELADATLRLSREQLVYNVKTLYVNILSFQAREKAQRTYVESLQRLHEQISREFRLGKKARVDQLKAAAELEAAKAELAGTGANIAATKAALESLLNLDRLPPLEEIKLSPESVTAAQEQLVARLKDTSRLRIARLARLRNARLADKETSALYPQIVLNAGYGQNFGPNDSSHPDSGDWNNHEVWQVGLNLKWNIFDFGNTRNRLAKARIVEQQSRYQETETLLELKRAVSEAVTKINAAVSDYLSARTELELTRQTAQIEQVRYDRGAATLNDLLYARARHLLAESRFIAAGYTYEVANFHLEYLLETGDQK